MERNENGLAVPSAPRMPSAEDGGCGCAMTSGRQLAMVYSPIQCFRMLYKPEDALMRGTLFEELDKPLSEVLV